MIYKNPMFERLLVWSWISAATLLPSLSTYTAISGYDFKRLVEIGLLALTAIAYGAKNPSTSPPKFIKFSLVGMLALGTFSSLLSLSPPNAFLEIATSVLMVSAIATLASANTGYQHVVSRMIR